MRNKFIRPVLSLFIGDSGLMEEYEAGLMGKNSSMQVGILRLRNVFGLRSDSNSGFATRVWVQSSSSQTAGYGVVESESGFFKGLTDSLSTSLG